MGGAERFGDAEAPAAAEHQTPTSIEIDKVARGDIDRLHPGPGAQHHAHPLAPVREAAIPAPTRPRLAMLPHKPCLGAADRRQVKPEPEVAREAETPGMSDPLAVAENRPGLIPKFPESAEERRNFAEGEEPRDVGKGDPALDLDELDELEPRKGMDGNGSRQGVAVPPIPHIGASNQVQPLGKRPEKHTAGKAMLEGHSLLRGEIPGVDHGGQARGLSARWKLGYRIASLEVRGGD